MRLGRAHRETIDRLHVLRASGEGDDTIDFGTQ
jgi:hypothetical protein